MFKGNYSFTENWFDNNVPVWKKIIEKLPAQRRFIIEIGSYEGKSACWLIENAFQYGGTLYCIDTWEGSAEHDKTKMAEIHGRFRSNIAKAIKIANSEKADSWVTAEARACTSLFGMTSLISRYEGADLADLIYIDGSHTAKDVLTDLVLSYYMLKPGGFLICDDYAWRRTTNPVMSPKLAIDSFANCFSREMSMVVGVPLCQMVFIKHEMKDADKSVTQSIHRPPA